MSAGSSVVGPMSLAADAASITPPSISSILAPREQCQCPCSNCCEIFDFPEERSLLLSHIFSEHFLVIADVDKIALLKDYLDFWRGKFTENDLSEFCTTMLADTKCEGQVFKDKKYYLLSEVLPLDNQLRKDLQTKRLEKILNHQKLERDNTNYERECLFCRTVVKGTRSDFLSHLFEKHNFYVAKLENLIFTADLIEVLNDKLNNSVCIYCEKVFKDRAILKEHMRKKAHKRINPSNSEYDKYFISNYLEMGKNWQSYLKNVGLNNQKKTIHYSSSNNSKKSAAESSSESDGNWSDWDEKDSISIVCLFCKQSENHYSDILSHMIAKHGFNFETTTKQLNFYEKLKMINYTRRQIHFKKCIECNEEFSDLEKLLIHMSIKGHFKISNPMSWNQPEFYFSTYEDDGLLYSLEDIDETEDTDVSEKLESINIDSNSDVHISQEVALSVFDS